MTKKQKQKFAREIFKYEQIHQNPSSSKEDKSQAEQKIMSLTESIMSEKNGLDLLNEIDEIIQQNYYNNFNLKGEN